MDSHCTRTFAASANIVGNIKGQRLGNCYNLEKISEYKVYSFGLCITLTELLARLEEDNNLAHLSASGHVDTRIEMDGPFDPSEETECDQTGISRHQSPPHHTAVPVTTTLHPLQMVTGSGPPLQSTVLFLYVTALNKTAHTECKLIDKPCVKPAMP